MELIRLKELYTKSKYGAYREFLIKVKELNVKTYTIERVRYIESNRLEEYTQLLNKEIANSNLDEYTSLDDIANEVGCSKSYLLSYIKNNNLKKDKFIYYSNKETKLIIKKAKQHLSNKEKMKDRQTNIANTYKKYIDEGCLKGCTLKKVGAKFGISSVRVYQIVQANIKTKDTYKSKLEIRNNKITKMYNEYIKDNPNPKLPNFIKEYNIKLEKELIRAVLVKAGVLITKNYIKNKSINIDRDNKIIKNYKLEKSKDNLYTIKQYIKDYDIKLSISTIYKILKTNNIEIKDMSKLEERNTKIINIFNKELIKDKKYNIRKFIGDYNFNLSYGGVRKILERA